MREQRKVKCPACDQLVEIRGMGDTMVYAPHNIYRFMEGVERCEASFRKVVEGDQEAR